MQSIWLARMAQGVSVEMKCGFATLSFMTTPRSVTSVLEAGTKYLLLRFLGHVFLAARFFFFMTARPVRLAGNADVVRREGPGFRLCGFIPGFCPRKAFRFLAQQEGIHRVCRHQASQPEGLHGGISFRWS